MPPMLGRYRRLIRWHSLPPQFHGSLAVASFGMLACVLYRATHSWWTPIIFHAVTDGIITAASWPLDNGLYSGF